MTSKLIKRQFSNDKFPRPLGLVTKSGINAPSFITYEGKGYLAFNIFPICLAIKVLPVPGGPYNKIP